MSETGEFFELDEVIENENFPQPCTVTIRSHHGMHLDEYGDVWLFLEFARPEHIERYAKREQGYKYPILEFGVGGGPLDEHTQLGEPNEKKKGECSMTLTAKALGVDKKPELQQILNGVRRCDTKSGVPDLHLASIVKDCNLPYVYGNRPKLIMTLVKAALGAKYLAQRHFHQKTRKDYEKARKKVDTIKGRGGQDLTLVLLHSDDEAASKYARTSAGDRASVVIQRRRSGNTYISVDKDRKKIDLRDTGCIIRVEERNKRFYNEPLSSDVLRKPGKVEGAECWHFPEHWSMLLNGSLSHPNVSPNMLTDEELLMATRIGLDVDYFDPNFEEQCKKGYCNSSEKYPCPLYPYKLARCENVRNEQQRRLKERAPRQPQKIPGRYRRPQGSRPRYRQEKGR